MYRNESYTVRPSKKLIAGFVLLGTFNITVAQEFPVLEGTPLPDYAHNIVVDDLTSTIEDFVAVDNGLPNILLTGYWPPTNEMLRQFSPFPDHNLTGWAGCNWEGRGYNIYAFFPEFPNGMGSGSGDFEVDYQVTSPDFWYLIEKVKPIAIISHGRSGYDYDWELEGGNRMYQPLSNWSNDYVAPNDPTPDLPIADQPGDDEKMSTLPIAEIVAAVEAELPELYPYGTNIDTSRFLCNFMGYHINWWHEMHSDPHDPMWNVTAGYIHVGYRMSLEQAIQAVEVTTRTVIDHVDGVCLQRCDSDNDGDVDLSDFDIFEACVSGPAAGYDPACADMDMNNDGGVDLLDFAVIQRFFTSANP